MKLLIMAGIAGSLAEAMPDFIAVTIKPQTTRAYVGLTPLQQQKVLWKRFKEAVQRLPSKMIRVLSYELHYERFQNGNLHAHGVIYIEGVIKDSIWPEQFAKDFLQKNERLGKYCITAKGSFGDKVSWIQYINKSNVLNENVSITPYMMAQNIHKYVDYCPEVVEVLVSPARVKGDAKHIPS